MSNRIATEEDRTYSVASIAVTPAATSKPQALSVMVIGLARFKIDNFRSDESIVDNYHLHTSIR